jgi:hypothetical protein
MVRNSTVKVSIPREHGDPRRLVEIAKGMGAEEFDEIWCVFDRDQHERFHEAIQMARDNGFELAVSNPDFELWLLLHFRESPGARHRDDLRRLLRDEHLPGYDKKLDFDKLAPGVPAATRRAERLARDAHDLGDDPFKNPTTGFYRLTNSMARKDDDE